MDASELAFAGIHRQAGALRAGEVSSHDLVSMYLERIDRLGHRFNAFRVVLGERALAEAADADRRIEAGESAPLLGVPVALKDNVDVAGEVTANGTAAWDEPATADASLYRRLREAGAVLIGKTTLPELAIWPFTETDAWGITRNPWNTGHSSGGSSGGSAAAVAAGLVGIASASDGGGSIRIPAAHCGLFGLKPQRGRISLGPAPDHWMGLSVSGCVSRRVIDTALWLDVTAGPEAGDADAPPPPDRPYVDAAATVPGPLRIAVTVDVPRPAAPPIVADEVKAGVERLAAVLAALGHTIVERDVDWGGLGNDVTPRYLAGIAEDGARVPHPPRLEARTRGMIRLGGAIPRPIVRRAREREALHAERLNRIFDDVDLVLMPTTGIAAPSCGRWGGRGALRTLLSISRVYPCTIPWNYTGQPAASVPLPPDAPGALPQAGQLVAPPNREDLLISVSAQLEAAIGWPERIPEELA